MRKSEGDSMNEKTELEKAWDNLIIAIAQSLKIDKFLDWILKKMK